MVTHDRRLLDERMAFLAIGEEFDEHDDVLGLKVHGPWDRIHSLFANSKWQLASPIATGRMILSLRLGI